MLLSGTIAISIPRIHRKKHAFQYFYQILFRPHCPAITRRRRGPQPTAGLRIPIAQNNPRQNRKQKNGNICTKKKTAQLTSNTPPVTAYSKVALDISGTGGEGFPMPTKEAFSETSVREHSENTMFDCTEHLYFIPTFVKGKRAADKRWHPCCGEKLRIKEQNRPPTLPETTA